MTGIMVVQKNEMGFWEFPVELFKACSIRHDGTINRYSGMRPWMAELTEYRSRQDIERKWIPGDFYSDELDVKHAFEVGKIYQGRVDIRRSNKYGERHELVFVPRKVGEARMEIEVFPTPYRAFHTIAKEAVH